MVIRVSAALRGRGQAECSQHACGPGCSDTVCRMLIHPASLPGRVERRGPGGVLGDSLAVELPTLTRKALVRIQVPSQSALNRLILQASLALQRAVRVRVIHRCTPRTPSQGRRRDARHLRRPPVPYPPEEWIEEWREAVVMNRQQDIHPLVADALAANDLQVAENTLQWRSLCRTALIIASRAHAINARREWGDYRDGSRPRWPASWRRSAAIPSGRPASSPAWPTGARWSTRKPWRRTKARGRRSCTTGRRSDVSVRSRPPCLYREAFVSCEA